MPDTILVAAAQIAPVFLDKAATVDKVCETLSDAAGQGVKLMLLPEAFLPAYPLWTWKIPVADKASLDALYAELLENSVSLNGPEIPKLCRAAKANGVSLVIGVNERSAASRATIFNTMLYISEAGELLGIHRKLVPTAAERLVWAGGDGSTMETFDLPYARIGGLVCWENYMPLARYAMFSQGTQIYMAPTWDRGEPWLSTLRHIAKEGYVFVIGCGSALRRDDVPDRYAFKSLYPATDEWLNPGDSMIVSPEGAILAGPMHAQQGLLLAELNLTQTLAPKWKLDVAGHYARPDVFTLTLDKRPHSIMDVINPERGAGAP